HVEGSAIALVATDAPMLPHQLRRMAVRAGLGLGRCGSVAENWAGEIQAAFSTAQTIPLEATDSPMTIQTLPDGADMDTSRASTDRRATRPAPASRAGRHARAPGGRCSPGRTPPHRPRCERALRLLRSPNTPEPGVPSRAFGYSRWPPGRCGRERCVTRATVR